MAAELTRNDKVLRWALGASLGVNLVIVGMIAGAAYRFNGPHAGPMENMRSYGTPYIRALPDDHRRAVFDGLRKKKDSRILPRAARRALYDQTIAALRAEPFDLDRITMVLDAQRDATLGVQQSVQSAWLAEIASMSTKARTDYADRLETMLDHHPMRHPKPGKRGSDD